MPSSSDFEYLFQAFYEYNCMEHRDEPHQYPHHFPFFLQKIFQFDFEKILKVEKTFKLLDF